VESGCEQALELDRTSACVFSVSMVHFLMVE
jgi:hypothetical protein